MYLIPLPTILGQYSAVLIETDHHIYSHSPSNHYSGKFMVCSNLVHPLSVVSHLQPYNCLIILHLIPLLTILGQYSAAFIETDRHFSSHSLSTYYSGKFMVCSHLLHSLSILAY